MSKLKEKGFPQYEPRTVLRHAKKPICDETEDKRKLNRGRPRKLDARDNRKLLLSLKKFRDSEEAFSSIQIQHEAGISEALVSNRTVRRSLNEMEYFYLQSRKKGLLSPDDLAIRLKFARKYVKKPVTFWQTGISFYLDGVGWAHKRNPSDHAVTLRTRTWRKRSEGCKRGCTAKGKKEGAGGKMVYFMVAIAYGKGVIKAVEYEGPINGEKFSNIVRQHFPAILAASANPQGSRFLQDGDRSQNATVSKKAIDDTGCKVFPIPARSPDFNPIENVFHLGGNQIKRDGKRLQIESETYSEFKARCYDTLMNFPSDVIDNTISSMPRRLRAAINDHGNRTKY